jgi:hypothetical protein
VDVAAVEPDLIPNLELRRRLGVTVVIGLVLSLGMLQVVAEYPVELLKLFNKTLSGRVDRFGGGGNQQEVSGMESLVSEKGVSLVEAFWVLLYTNSA